MDRLFPLGDGIGFVSLVDRMLHDFPLKVVNAARISYAKEKDEYGEQDKKLIKYLWKHEHTSPFRHSFYTFHVKFPLFVARQWMKYQVGSTWRVYELDGTEVSLDVIDLMFDTDKGCNWNELSGRYSKLTPEFYFPMMMRGNAPKGNKQKSVFLDDSFNHQAAHESMVRECTEAYRKYEQRLELGIAKELARMLLPQNIYTQAYWTVSLQAVLHFLHQRLADDAQYEIKMYANAVYDLVKEDLTKMGILKGNLLEKE